jgi:hypothetical protein
MVSPDFVFSFDKFLTGFRASMRWKELNNNLRSTRYLTHESAKGFSYLFHARIATFDGERVCIRYERRSRKQQEPSFQGWSAGSA